MTTSPKKPKPNVEQLVKELYQYIDEQLSLGHVPRLQDLVHHAKTNQILLSKRHILHYSRLHKDYASNVQQQRFKLRSRRQRPIVTNALGYVQADIAYYSIVREYPTAKTYLHGFLVVKDILSRYLYVELLKGPKSGPNLVKVLQRVLDQHEKRQVDYKIKGLGFDREPAIMGREVQNFLAEKNISFHGFQFSDSKAKVAENAIRLIRTDIARLTRFNPNWRWWNILQDVAQQLNNKEIIINGKRMGYTPDAIRMTNLPQFIERLHKVDPSQYMSQFNPLLPTTRFKFKKGDYVRPKTIATSSQVLGEKRSIRNLDLDTFVILKQVPYFSKKGTTEPGYRCQHLETREIEFFSEEDISLALLPAT